MISRCAVSRRIALPKFFEALLLSPPQHPLDSIQSHLQIRERRSEREPNEVVTRRVEQVSTMGRVDVEEDSRNYDGFFFEQLFEEGLEMASREISWR